MMRYIGKRLLLFVPVVIITAVAAFIITTYNTQDIIQTRLQNTESDQFVHYNTQYEEEYKLLGYDKPLFYFTIQSAVLPDTLYKIADDAFRKHIVQLCFTYSNKAEVMLFIKGLQQWEHYCVVAGTADSTNSIKWLNYYNIGDSLLHTKNIELTINQVTRADTGLLKDAAFNKIYMSAKRLVANSHHLEYLQYIPAFYWHGACCRFNTWLMGVFSGSFGISYADQRPVNAKIKEAMPITIIISSISLILLFVLGILLGVIHSLNQNTWYGRMIQPILFLFHSIPNYTIALWSIVLFCCGGFLCWLPTGGLGDDSLPLLQRIPYIILPVCCWILPLLSVVAMHTSAAHSDAMESQYVLTARAKGVSSVRLLRHTLRPALVPVITLGGLIAPAALSGSVMIETLFSIPGVGKLSYEALLSRDVPVVLAVTILSVILSVIVQLVADMLLYIIDPRIRQTIK